MQTRNVLFWGLIQILLKPRLCFSSSSMGWEVSPGWAFPRNGRAIAMHRARSRSFTQDRSHQNCRLSYGSKEHIARIATKSLTAHFRYVLQETKKKKKSKQKPKPLWAVQLLDEAGPQHEQTRESRGAGLCTPGLQARSLSPGGSDPGRFGCLRPTKKSKQARCQEG